MKKVGFIGAGNMARALIRGLLDSGKYRKRELWASDPDRRQLARLAKEFKVEGIRDNLALASRSQTVVLAVKPQIIDDVLREIRPAVSPGRLFISIAAGVKTARLEKLLGGEAKVVRVMPNTPALVARAMSVMVRGRRAAARDERLCRAIFGCVGEVITVRRESLLDAVTAVSGSGPAYVYLFAEALVKAGVSQGLAAKTAAKLAYETIAGAAQMLIETGQTPAALRQMVSSPGGTTVAGLAVLEERGFAGAVSAAVRAAARRSRELGRG